MPSESLSAFCDRLDPNLPRDAYDEEVVVYAGDLCYLIAAVRAGEALANAIYRFTTPYVGTHPENCCCGQHLALYEWRRVTGGGGA